MVRIIGITLLLITTLLSCKDGPIIVKYLSAQQGSIDVAPELLSITRKIGNNNPTNAININYTATFNKAVSNVDLSDFALIPIPLKNAGRDLANYI